MKRKNWRSPPAIAAFRFPNICGKWDSERRFGRLLRRAFTRRIDSYYCTPSHAQSIRLKKLSQAGALTEQAIRDMMQEEKPNQAEQIKFRRDEFKQYFPPRYTGEQIKRDILKGLELLKRQRERDRDAR